MLVSTPAIVLHAFAYGETSKIVRLSTRDHGVQSVIAKGAARSRTRFGAQLQMLSEGVASFYLKAHRDLHTLAAFDVSELHRELALDVRRYAAGVALAELILRSAPTEPHPEIFDVLSHALRRLAREPDRDIGVVALGALWSAVATLGFAPVLDVCVRCGAALGGRARFALAEGGLLCARCGRGTAGGMLGADDRDALVAFTAGAPPPSPLDAKHVAAHRRLLARFVRRHLGEERELHALAFWEAT